MTTESALSALRDTPAPTLDLALVFARVDEEARAVLDCAARLATYRAQQENLARQALLELPWSFSLGRFDEYWETAAARVVVREEVLPIDLAIAAIVGLGGNPERLLGAITGSLPREEAEALAARATAASPAQRLGAPWSYSWWTWLGDHPDQKVDLGTLIAAIPDKQLNVFFMPDFDTGTLTVEEALAALRARLPNVFPTRVPTLALPDDAAPILKWLTQWPNLELHLGVPVPLECLTAGALLAQENDTFDGGAAYLNAEHLIGLNPWSKFNATPQLAPCNSGFQGPYIGEIERLRDFCRTICRKLRQGATMPPKYAALLDDLGGAEFLSALCHHRAGLAGAVSGE